MRHFIIRGILTVIWLAAAIVSSLTGNWQMAALYIFLGGFFLYSAYGLWKKEKTDRT